MTIPLILLTLISASGLLLYARRSIPSQLINTLIALGAWSMLAVSLVHIFPEALEQTEYAVYAFLIGFIIIYLIEELLTTHRHDHAHGDHAHEDPHEHYDHVAIVSFVAIFAHTLIDGIGIRAGMWLSESAGYAILIGIAIHQIPVSLSLAAIMRESKLQIRSQLCLIWLFALAAPLGYLLSDLVLTWVSEAIVGLAAAFAWWSLLYIATTDLLPVIHSTTKNKYLSVFIFLLGISLMTLFANHEHHRDDHHEWHDDMEMHTDEK
jgi:zinc transporter ZupT